MTINKLIALLSKFPGRTRVVVRGYEDGFSDVVQLRDIRLNLDVNTADYYGPHEQSDIGVRAIQLVGSR